MRAKAKKARRPLAPGCHAIGTWKNRYGGGLEGPRDWTPPRGVAVHQLKDHGK